MRKKKKKEGKKTERQSQVREIKNELTHLHGNIGFIANFDKWNNF